ncbi:MAG TPA: PDZ domain-containing protein, partial [Vicinamibacteria bacterium]|nr:PDZ domain-containing protein [Vicinamibacteria bacterium]
MRTRSVFTAPSATAALLLQTLNATAGTQKAAPQPPRAIQMEVDARDAPRHVYHAQLVIPARPGPMTLVYPKWVAGAHSPSGPIADLTGLRFRAAGQTLEWRRDAVDLFAFHIVVPPGAEAVEAQLDYLAPSGGGGSFRGVFETAQLAWIYWHKLLLAPQGVRSDAMTYRVSLRLPSGWRHGTSLEVASEASDRVEFAPVSLAALIDSPVLVGAHFKTIPLADAPVPHRIHLAADSVAALQAPEATVDAWKRLVAEALALFGAHHYRSYTFLHSLSDQTAQRGLEHHEQSDNLVQERTLLDEDLRRAWAFLLPHEMSHSWNGKHRRPAGLLTDNVSDPMRTELLWVYEGLTMYLGYVLAARSGLLRPDEYQQAIAYEAALVDHSKGREWRPLVDTATSAQILFPARVGGSSWRRGVDFYPEGAVLWLEADVLIRRESRGTKSLDDFLRAFFGGVSGPPTTIPYTLDDVLVALEKVHAYDWRGFWKARVDALNPRAPLGGLSGAGFSLAYGEARTAVQKSLEAAGKYVEESFSVGLVLSPEGAVRDVIPGSVADKAGLAPGDTLLAVGGRRYSTQKLREAIKDSRTKHGVDLVVANGDFVGTRHVEYDGGARYPRLD